MLDLEELRKIPLFSHLPEEQLQCLSEAGSEIHLPAGTIIAQQGDPPDGFYVILEGVTEWTRKVGQQEAHAVTLKKGEVFAELILLLDEPYPTTGRTVTDVRLYKFAPEQFWEILKMCPTILQRILKISVQRSQIHESVTQQQAKLISLGTLSAGLAHELNNPAAAASRNVNNLEEVLQKLPALALKMHQQPIAPEQLQFLCDFYGRAIASAKKTEKLDPLAQSEREDEITDWLEDRGVKESWKLAPTLVAAGLEIDALEELSDRVDSECVGGVLTWLEATLTGSCLLEEIQQSSQRISELIKAMKDYSYMDRAPMQQVDIHEGINSTLTILKHKLKHGVTVKKEYGKLPSICAHGRELNQVWTNLIDNAIDAMKGKGNLYIKTDVERDRVLVEIGDDGTGIPEAIQSRIFEQFFSTKEAGKGTGLGLDIARRIVVGQHQGDIRFDSQPGNTRFQIRLPIKSK
jgi:signal transduction histidine kinase